jgi:hypothetical protein
VPAVVNASRPVWGGFVVGGSNVALDNYLIYATIQITEESNNHTEGKQQWKI